MLQTTAEEGAQVARDACQVSMLVLDELGFILATNSAGREISGAHGGDSKKHHFGKNYL